MKVYDCGSNSLARCAATALAMDSLVVGVQVDGGELTVYESGDRTPTAAIAEACRLVRKVYNIEHQRALDQEVVLKREQARATRARTPKTQAARASDLVVLSNASRVQRETCNEALDRLSIVESHLEQRGGPWLARL